MLSCGQLLDNRYRLDERIATGGMGDVWRGTDVLLGRVVAVKVLRAAMLADPEFSARFYGEARMLAAFRHPGVVEVYDYNSASADTDEQCAYLVMAYVAGEPLSSRIKDGARLGVTETMSIVAQAADALHAAHQNGTVHRDVKPGNLMIKPNGTVILVDFGVARSVEVTSVTGINSIVGTALYMAPEQVSKGDLSAATDIYALGAVAYQCLAGHPPFDGDNALQVALCHLEDEPPPLPDDVPPVVRNLIARAMAKHPADRFPSAAAFADAALETSNAATATAPTAVTPAATRTAAWSPPTPRTTGTITRTTPVRHAYTPPPAPKRNRRTPLLLALAGLLVLGGGAILALANPWGAGSPGSGRPAVSEAPAAPLDQPSQQDTPGPQTSRRPTRSGGSSVRPETSTIPEIHPPSATTAKPTTPAPPSTTTTKAPDPPITPTVTTTLNLTPTANADNRPEN